MKYIKEISIENWRYNWKQKLYIINRFEDASDDKLNEWFYCYKLKVFTQEPTHSHSHHHHHHHHLNNNYPDHIHTYYKYIQRIPFYIIVLYCTVQYSKV